MTYTIFWFLCFLIALIYIFIDKYQPKEIIFIKGLKDLIKKEKINLIVDYQSEQTPSDQIELIAKWLDSIDFEEIEPWQYNALKNKILDKIAVR